MLKTDDMKHMGNHTNIGLLKIGSLNVHKQFQAARLSQLKCFHDSLEFFKEMSPHANHKAICPNFWMMRLVAFHAGTTATCERSFRLSNLVKTTMRSTMTDKRMNHLCACKRYKKELHDLCINYLMKEFVNITDEHVRTFGPSTCKH